MFNNNFNIKNRPRVNQSCYGFHHPQVKDIVYNIISFVQIQIYGSPKGPNYTSVTLW